MTVRQGQGDPCEGVGVGTVHRIGVSSSGAASEIGRMCVLAGLLAVTVPLWVAEVQAQDTAVDVELIIATDVSNSMDLGERLLQRQGYISVFTNEDMVAAITAGLTYVVVDRWPPSGRGPWISRPCSKCAGDVVHPCGTPL